VEPAAALSLTQQRDLGQLTSVFMQLTAMKAMLESRISQEEHKQDGLRDRLRQQEGEREMTTQTEETGMAT